MAKKMKKPKPKKRAVVKVRRSDQRLHDANARARFNATVDACAKVVPMNWCDVLLTGPDAPKAGKPFDGRAVEQLLRGVQDRIRALKVEAAAIT